VKEYRLLELFSCAVAAVFSRSALETFGRLKDLRRDTVKAHIKRLQAETRESNGGLMTLLSIVYGLGYSKP